MNLSKFKKIKVEENHTILQHPDGHEIRILHSKVTPDMKKQLASLPQHFAEGGEVMKENYSKSKKPKKGPDRRQALSTAMREAHRYANGGEVKKKTGVFDELEEKIRESFNAPTPVPSPTPTREQEYDAIRKKNRENFGGNYAEGGDVKKPAPINQDRAQEVQDSMRKAFNFADGGQAPIQGEDMPVTASKLESQYAPEEEAAQQASQPQSDGRADLAAAIKNMTQVYAGASQSAPPPQQVPQQQIPQSPAPAVDASAQPPPSPSAGMSPMVSGSPSMPPQPQGSLQQQAIQGGEQVNQAEMAQAANTQASMGQQADIQGQQAQKLQDLHAKYEQMGNNLHHNYEKTAEEISQGKIDPNNWWGSKSTGSKVLTAIGMMFAGAGGGLAGDPGMVGKVIDAAIDRDIDSQKANLANKQTLLSKYMDMYNDLPQAEAAARLTLSAATEGLMAQQAIKLGSANAMQAAKATIAARRQALLPQMESLAKGQVMSQMYGEMSKPQQASGNEEEAYQQRMGQMRMVNSDLGKDMESKYLPNVGLSRVPVPEKLRSDIASRKDLSDKLAQLELFAKKHGGTVMDRAVVNQGAAMAKDVQDTFRTARDQGVFKQSESEFVNSMIHGDPTAFFSNIRVLPGYRAIRKSNDDTLKQVYKAYGIRPFNGTESTPAGGDQSKAAMEWLKQNPNDPRAPAIRKKLGI